MIRDTSIMVSVLCQTYNHEKYIAECLQSLVSQQVNFRYEILVHDDASTDSTADIIRQFEKEYPDLIKPIYQKVNQWSLGNKVFSGIQLPRCTGKYIAICEGDDYWIDSFKLQKQVDYLESHPDYSMCFHKCKELIEIDNIKPVFSHLECREYMGVEVLTKWTVPTASVLFHNYTSYFRKGFPQGIAHGDIFLFLLLAEKGKLFCMEYTMSVYRRNANGVTFRPQNISLLKSYLDHYRVIDKFFHRKYHKVLVKRINLIQVRLICKYFPKPAFLKYMFYCAASPILSIQNIKYIMHLKSSK